MKKEGVEHESKMSLTKMALFFSFSFEMCKVKMKTTKSVMQRKLKNTKGDHSSSIQFQYQNI